jgi:hypothetical protein
MGKVALVLLACALALPGSGSAAVEAVQASSPPPVPAVSITDEVAELNQSVRELVTLLQKYIDRQQVELLLRRVEIGLQKIGPLEQELRDLRARRAADARELNYRRTQLAAREELESLGTPGVNSEEERKQQALLKVEIEADIKLFKGRISQADQRIVELENELARENRSIQNWEAVVDQRFGPP